MREINDKLDEILARAEAATNGPWEYFGGAGTFAVRTVGSRWQRVVGCDIDLRVRGSAVGHYDGGVWEMEDAIFIAAARTDVPALVKALRIAIFEVGACNGVCVCRDCRNALRDIGTILNAAPELKK